jgi:LmbE family N-acetylglucosaminyl deacetylase
MQALSTLGKPGAPFRVLCLGAHSDDIEIGCGGLILDLLSRSAAVDVDWVVFSARVERRAEARRSAALFLKGARKKRVRVENFRDGFFPYQGARIKRVFEEIKKQPAPDLVLTHYRDDRHQDHRVLSDLAWNTFRNHWILEYEIPKFDGDLGVPNCFVPLDRSTCDRKVEYLKTAFATQWEKHWFTAETFMGLMRLRGMECCAEYAEAFYGRKTVLDLSQGMRKG